MLKSLGTHNKYASKEKNIFIELVFFMNCTTIYITLSLLHETINNTVFKQKGTFFNTPLFDYNIASAFKTS